MIHEPALLAVTGELAVGGHGGSDILKSPGQLPKHYSPKAKLLVFSWANEADLKKQLSGSSFSGKYAASTIHIISHTRIPSASEFGRVSVIPHDPEAFARAIYAELHQCDEAGAELIVVEALPETHEWRAIADRLKRAAA
jgi:L-threonylcarbamoyladenylate synthase